MKLVKILFPDLELESFGDLNIIMELIYLNRTRLKFIK